MVLIEAVGHTVLESFKVPEEVEVREWKEVRLLEIDAQNVVLRVLDTHGEAVIETVGDTVLEEDVLGQTVALSLNAPDGVKEEE